MIAHAQICISCDRITRRYWCVLLSVTSVWTRVLLLVLCTNSYMRVRTLVCFILLERRTNSNTRIRTPGHFILLLRCTYSYMRIRTHWYFIFLQRQSIPWGHTVSFFPWLLSVVWIIFLFVFRCPIAWMKREPGANPGWARRCNRGRNPQYNHCSLEDGKVWMECDPRVRRPTWRSVRVLRKRIEQYVHIWEKNGISQVNYLIGLGFFFSRPWKNGGCYEVESIFFRGCRYVLMCFNH